MHGLILQIIPSENLLLKQRTIIFLLINLYLLVTKLGDHAHMEFLDKEKIFHGFSSQNSTESMLTRKTAAQAQDIRKHIQLRSLSQSGVMTKYCRIGTCFFGRWNQGRQ